MECSPEQIEEYRQQGRLAELLTKSQWFDCSADAYPEEVSYGDAFTAMSYDIPTDGPKAVKVEVRDGSVVYLLPERRVGSPQGQWRRSPDDGRMTLVEITVHTWGDLPQMPVISTDDLDRRIIDLRDLVNGMIETADCPHLDTDAGGNCRAPGCMYNSEVDWPRLVSGQHYDIDCPTRSCDECVITDGSMKGLTNGQVREMMDRMAAAGCANCGSGHDHGEHPDRCCDETCP